MAHVDGFQRTDSFRFDRIRSSSSMSLSSSSGYGSRLSLSPAASQRRSGLSKYFKEKLSKHKSLASLLLSSPTTSSGTTVDQEQIYEHVWNLEEQIEKFRSQVFKETSDDPDNHSIISMSVDAPTRSIHRFEYVQTAMP